MIFDLIISKASSLVLWAALTFVALPSCLYAEQFKSTGTIDTYFSPRGGATEPIEEQFRLNGGM